MPLPDHLDIPSTISELHDYLYMLRIMRAARKHEVFPKLNDGVAFEVFREGLRRLKSRLGDEAHDKLLRMLDQVENKFRLDPDEKTGEAHQGFLLITEMEEFLMDWKAERRSRKKSSPSK